MISLVEVKKKHYDNTVYAKRWREKNPERASTASKRWRERNREFIRQRSRENRLLKAYGITIEQFDALLQSQNGRCAICEIQLGRASKTTHVDHCHATGKVRSILCDGCNNMLGRSGDNAARLRAGAAYLDRWTAIHA